MSLSLEWAPEAVDALEAIHALLEARSQRRAAVWFEDVLEAVENIRTFPEIGAVAPDVANRRLRQYPVGHYRIIYRLHADEISIESIVHRSTRLR